MTTHQNLILILHPISHFSEILNLLLFYIWIVITYLSIATVSISYLYRYRLVCLNKRFSIYIHLAWDFLWIFLGSGCSINIYYTFSIREKDKIYLAEEYVPLFRDDDGKVNSIGIVGKLLYFLRNLLIY